MAVVPGFSEGFGGGQGGFGNFGPFGGSSSSFGSYSSPFVGKSLQGYGQDMMATTQQFGFNKKLAELQEQGANQRAQIAANAAMFPAQVRQQEFGQVFPFLQSQFGNLQKAFTAGGQSPASPEISVAPVFNQQQTQQQINATRAANDATTGSQIRQDQQSLAGRGFGSNSPLLQLLTQGRQMAGNQLNAQAQQQIPFQTAQANAEQLLNSQRAREAQFASRQQEDIARRTPILQSSTALLQALAGMI